MPHALYLGPRDPGVYTTVYSVLEDDVRGPRLLWRPMPALAAISRYDYRPRVNDNAVQLNTKVVPPAHVPRPPGH